MKQSNQQRYTRRASVIAVSTALAALAGVPAAYAEEMTDEVRDLTQASSQVEVGVGNVSKDSAKFGEFNGRNEKGGYFVGGFDLRKGGGDDSAFRIRANGTDLGLENRSIGVEVGEQGRYRVTFGHDELQRNYTDSFQTFYNGSGSTNLTLPASYPAAATRLSVTTSQNAALANWANLQAPYATVACAAAANKSGACAGPGVLIPALMHPEDLSTKRKIEKLGFSFQFDREWGFKAGVRSEQKDGTKLTGFGMNGPGRGLMLPEPIDSKTDIYEASINYLGKNGHFNVGYSGSMYKNNVNLWTAASPFQNLNLLNNTAYLTGAPDNQMHQLNMSGGFKFSPKTKLVMSGSYTRMTQNENFNVNYPASYVIPGTSANAKVINSTFMARLTAQPVKDLGLIVGYKYSDRDNQTPSNLYAVAGADNGNGTLNRTFANEPQNRKQQTFNLDADYSLARGRVVSAGYEWQKIDFHNAGESVVRADGHQENTLKLEYRDSFADSLTGRVGYSRAQRRMDGSYRDGDPMPLTPVVAEEGLADLVRRGYLTVAGGVYTQVAPFTFSAADPILPGFRNALVADRNRDKLRGALNYQASESLVLDTSLAYNRDKYDNSQYGLKESKSWVFSLDAAYAANEKLSFHGNYTYEDMRSKQDSLSIQRITVANPEVAGSTSTALLAANNAATCPGSFITNTAAATNSALSWLDPCRKWGMEQADKIDTIGLGFKSNQLMGGRLELVGDVIWSKSRTPISMSGGTYTSNGSTGAGSTQPWYAAANLPEINSTMTELRLSGKYNIDKTSALRVAYLGRHLSSNDFQYDAYTNSVASQTLNGIGMTSPNYTVHAVEVSYLYRFY